MAVDEDRAMYWALTALWRYSSPADHAIVLEKEIKRLSLLHDTSLLEEKWTLGKTGKDLQIEQARKEEKRAKAEWQRSVEKLVNLETETGK